MKAILIATMLAGLMVLGGCASTMSPAAGGIYSDVTGPMIATTNTAGMKSGQAVCTSILGVVATGDCSIDAAMKAGGIKKVSHVDYHASNLIGIIAKMTTTVYGE